ncbi:MAG: SRPBCC domain-containing protein [Spirochaetota bacterium]
MKAEQQTLQVKTIVKASKQRVFAAWSQSELLQKWFAPGDMTVAHAEVEFRVGGLYLIRMQRENGEQPTVCGQYKEIIPEKRLVFTWKWQGSSEEETLVTVELSEVPEGTEVRVTHEKLASTELLERHLQGWQGCLDKLSNTIGELL